MGKDLFVSDVLGVIERRGGKLVAGRNGLNRVVKYYDIIDQPEIDGWVMEGTLFITTGYAIRYDKNALLDVIQRLNTQEAAALAIKTSFFKEFPNEALELCEKISFPLILLENTVSFIDITYPIMELLINAKNHTQNSRWDLRNENEKRMLNSLLFLDVAFPKNDDWEEIKYRINALHWPIPPIRLASIMIVTKISNQFVGGSKIKKAYKAIREYMAKTQNKSIVIIKNDECLCILSEKSGRETRKKLFNDIKKTTQEIVDDDVCIGISNVINDYHRIPKAYEEAQDAIKIGRVSSVLKDIVEIENMQFEQSLLRISKDPFFQQQVYDVFFTLKKYDVENNSNLMKTLEVFVRNAGNRKAAAEQLFLHRNTMSYRLKKIEDVIRVDLSDYQELIRISLLLNIRDFI